MGVRGFLSHREGEMKLKQYEIRLLPMSSKENHLIKKFHPCQEFVQKYRGKI